MKLKELLSGLSNLALSEAEAISVIALLREKSPSAVDAWHKVIFGLLFCGSHRTANHKPHSYDKWHVLIFACSWKTWKSLLNFPCLLFTSPLSLWPPVHSEARPGGPGERETSRNSAGGILHRQRQSETAQPGQKCSEESFTYKVWIVLLSFPLCFFML